MWEQATQVAYDAYMADIHPACGHPLTQTLWDANKADPDRWSAAFYRCEACEALEREQRVQAKKDEKADKEAEKDPMAAPLRRARLWFAFKIPRQPSG